MRKTSELDLQRRRQFGVQVRSLRKAADPPLSQEQLAHRARLDRTYVGAIERGERNLSIDNMYAIADALRCDLVDLLRGS